MIRLPARVTFLAPAAPAALLAFAPLPLTAQTFSLPPASPAPTSAPAGPSDERAGVAIPPRAVATPAPTPTPIPLPTAIPTSVPTSAPRPVPTASAPAPVRTAPTTGAAPSPQTGAAPVPAPGEIAVPGADADTGTAPQTIPSAPPTLPGTLPGTAPEIAPAAPATDLVGAGAPGDLWPYVAGGLGILALLGGGLVWRRRAAPKTLRIAPPLAGPRALAPVPAGADANAAPPRLDLTLDITTATRSLMMFTLEYRLVIANRSDRAVNDARVAVQLVCARTSGGAGPSAGAAHALADAGRIGPQQARTVTGTVQLPLSAITPLRQGQTPLFIPLAHVTLEGEGLPAQLRSFVIGTRSSSGRVHPISLDVPPGGIAGLVAQALSVPPVPAPPVGRAA